MNRRMQDQKKSKVGNKGQLHNMLYSKQFIFIVLTNSPASFGERKDNEHWGALFLKWILGEYTPTDKHPFKQNPSQSE